MLSEATWIHRAAAVFQGADTPLYIVGGAVRNPLMGLPISDVDVCGPARPEAVLAMCESTEVRAHLRAAHFGTVELHRPGRYAAYGRVHHLPGGQLPLRP